MIEMRPTDRHSVYVWETMGGTLKTETVNFIIIIKVVFIWTRNCNRIGMKSLRANLVSGPNHSLTFGNFLQTFFLITVWQNHRTTSSPQSVCASVSSGVHITYQVLSWKSLHWSYHHHKLQLWWSLLSRTFRSIEIRMLRTWAISWTVPLCL